MKKKVLFSIALAGLMLGSCSKDVIDNGGNGASWNENGTGYINLAINLPAVSSGSRAGDGTTSQGPTFDDGKGHEYAVKDATLMLFTFSGSTGSSEDGAILHSVYDMSTNFRDDDSDQITQTAGIVQEIKEIGGENQILALVVLNKGSLFTVENNLLKIGDDSYGSTSLGGTQLRFGTLNTKLAEEKSDNSWITDGYFLMSNAPLFNKPGGTTAPTGGATTTLFEIDRGYIAKSISEAAEKPASRIFVERAQAKIELKVKDDTNGFEINDWTNVEQYKLYITKWGIDNYNNYSRLTRKFNKDWAGYENASSSSKYYRFVDANKIDNLEYYRTYWGEDVNYTTASTTGGADILPALVSIKNNTTGLPNLNVDFGKCAYCFENTVDEVPATGKNLTRIILETELRKQNAGGSEEPATDFFTVNTDGKTIYFNGDKLESSSIQARIIAHVLNDPGVAAAAQNNGVTVADTDLTFEFADGALDKAGVLNNKNSFTVIYKKSDDDSEVKTAINTAINNSLYSVVSGSEVTNKINIDYHKGGKSYYQVFIRHFNNYECPWDEGTKPDQSSNPNQYLGRYGVLRNSWYVINVNSINNVGDSVYPVIPTDPVDKEEFFLAVEINIMPWAKRQQDVDL